MRAVLRLQVPRKPHAGHFVTERLLEAHEVAELLSVPVSWVRAETRAGQIPHLELGRS